MDKLNFEALLPRAKAVFYSAWIEEPTPAEIAYNKAYFEKYPQKCHAETWEEFCNKAALMKHARTLNTSWDYESAEIYRTPEEFLHAIEENEVEAALY